LRRREVLMIRICNADVQPIEKPSQVAELK